MVYKKHYENIWSFVTSFMFDLHDTHFKLPTLPLRFASLLTGTNEIGGRGKSQRAALRPNLQCFRLKKKKKKAQRYKAAYLQLAVPAASAQRHTVRRNTQTTDAILVALKSSHTLTLKGIPDVAVEVIVASKKKPPANWESNWRDTTENVVMGVLHQFTISPNIEQSAGSIIRTSAKCGSAGEESALGVSSTCKTSSSYWTALISDSCPWNVWTHLPLLISQYFAVVSQAPETKVFLSGAMETL